MAIKVGDRLPEATFRVAGPDGLEILTTKDVFAVKRVVLFAVPGAFTPTCHLKHLPGFVETADDFKKHGVDRVVCVAVNDPFVLAAWEEKSGGGEKVLFLSDGNAEFTKKIGMDFDGSGFGLGTRSKRYSALVEDGVVKILNVEESPAVAEASTPAKPLIRSRLAARWQERRHALASELVSALVFVMAVMAPDPVPTHLVTLRGFIQALP